MKAFSHLPRVLTKWGFYGIRSFVKGGDEENEDIRLWLWRFWLSLTLVTCPPPAPPPPPPPPPLPPVAPLPSVIKPPIKNPDTYIQATIGNVASLDPAWAYDTASVQIMLNIYETLVFYKGGSVTKFEPRLATEWVISPDGKEYRFKIRKGVKFHDGTVLTSEDVEYSFKRAMVQDRAGGLIWLLLFPLLGVHSTRETGVIVVDFKDIDKAVRVEGDWVVLHPPKTLPSLFSCPRWHLGFYRPQEVSYRPRGLGWDRGYLEEV